MDHGNHLWQGPEVVREGDKYLSKSTEAATGLTNFDVYDRVAYFSFYVLDKKVITDAAVCGAFDHTEWCEIQYDFGGVLVYNRFLNIVYEASTVEVKGEEALKESGAFDF